MSAEWTRWWQAAGQQELRGLVVLRWDPLGVADEPTAYDAYDAYLGRIARDAFALDVGRTTARLVEIERDSIGTGVVDERALRPVAAQLVAWAAPRAATRRAAPALRGPRAGAASVAVEQTPVPGAAGLRLEPQRLDSDDRAEVLWVEARLAGVTVERVPYGLALQGRTLLTDADLRALLAHDAEELAERAGALLELTREPRPRPPLAPAQRRVLDALRRAA